MFGDTIDLTIDAVVETHVKINQDGYASEYLNRDSVSDIRIRIRHTKTNPRNGVQYDRHNVEVVETVFATADTAEFQRKAYFVIEQLPSDGSTALMEALATWASAANLAKLLNWES